MTLIKGYEAVGSIYGSYLGYVFFLHLNVRIRCLRRGTHGFKEKVRKQAQFFKTES